jgi:hypothetical protein
MTDEATTTKPQTTAEATTRSDALAEEMSTIYDRHNPVSRTPSEEGSLHSAETFARANADRAQTEPRDTALDLPQSWGKKTDLWGKLDPEARKFVQQREQEFHKRVTELGQAAKQARRSDTDSQIGAVYERHRASIPRLPDGRELAPHEAFELLLSAHQRLESQPAAAIQSLAQQYGVDLSAFGRPEVDPITQIRQQERAAVQSEFQQMLAQQHAQQETARVQYLTEELGNFAKGKDYWAKIEDEVVHQIFANCLTVSISLRTAAFNARSSGRM